MKLSLLDAIVFIVVVSWNVVFGATSFSRNKTSDQFITGGGKIPVWAVGMSIAFNSMATV